MVTVNFSIPDEVKDAFNATFSDANKSVVIADSMREAVGRTHRKQSSDRAVDAIFARRHCAPVRSASELARSRTSHRLCNERSRRAVPQSIFVTRADPLFCTAIQAVLEYVRCLAYCVRPCLRNDCRVSRKAVHKIFNTYVPTLDFSHHCSNRFCRSEG